MAFIGNTGLGLISSLKLFGYFNYTFCYTFCWKFKNKDKKYLQSKYEIYTFMVIFAFAVYVFLIDRVGY